MKLNFRPAIRYCFFVLLLLVIFPTAKAQNWFNDPEFYTGNGANTVTGIQKMLVLQDDRIVIFGSFSSFNDTICNRLVCLKANGGIDTSFHAGGGIPGYVYTMAEQPDGKIILAGNFTSYNDTSYASILRIYANGVIDTTFNPGSGPDNMIKCCKIQPDGKLLVAGLFTTFNGAMAKGIVRLNADGSIDNTFISGTGLDNGTYLGQIILEPNGKIVLSGDAFSYNGTPVNQIFRVNSNGSIDTTFVINLSSYQPISTVLRQSDGDYIVIGSFTEFNGQLINHIAFLDSNGQLNPSFSSSGFLNDLSVLRGDVQPDDKILLFGSFNSYNGIVNNGILRLNADGTIDPEFNLSYGADNWVQAVGRQSHPGLIVAGMFDNFENETKKDITRILNCLPVAENVYDTACSAYYWSANGMTYTSSGTYTAYLTTTTGCDSTITLFLTIVTPTPLIVNTYASPSAANDCLGILAITTNGNADFIASIDGGAPFTHSGYQMVENLCSGVHTLLSTDACGDTLSHTFIIPVDSNFVFNNPFIDSIAVDSLGAVMEQCVIYYNSIDTAYIDSIFSTGNSVTVIWNIIDSSGSNFDTSSYVLNNGNGVYYLQLSIFCPNKSLGEYFTVGQAIYFQDGSISTTGIDNLESSLFKLFPNPTTNSVTILSNESSVLVVTDAQGKRILTKELHPTDYISLEQQSTGVYFFQFTSVKGSAVECVVKH